MPVTRCTHLKINGTRCTMPAASGRELCFHHESRMLRQRARPCPPSTYLPNSVVPLVYPEDHGAILENVHAIARAFVHSEIDDRKASILDRLMNTALRTLRQRPRLEKTVTSEEMIRHFRMDEDGNPRAIEPPTEVPPAKPEPVAETAEPAILPAISAEAEESCGQESDPAELQRIASSQNLSLLLSTLADEGKLRSLL